MTTDSPHDGHSYASHWGTFASKGGVGSEAPDLIGVMVVAHRDTWDALLNDIALMQTGAAIEDPTTNALVQLADHTLGMSAASALWPLLVAATAEPTPEPEGLVDPYPYPVEVPR